ncbi:MAG: ribonuclease E inhibitor RraB, partial [Planctomycetia bacterium]|nr:ribonuclease E inhibitor RraB [Planctomycetia bacterium]
MRPDVTQFWRDAAPLLASLSASPRPRAAMEALLDRLRRLDPRLYYHLGDHDGGTDLILSAEGHADLMPLLDEVARAMPRVRGFGVVPSYDGDLVLGRRNDDVFPSTENGDVLFRMASGGDRLWLPRAVDFSFVFPSEADARAFAARVAADGLDVETSAYAGAAGYTHEVVATTTLIPSHATITRVETSLGA